MVLFCSTFPVCFDPNDYCLWLYWVNWVLIQGVMCLKVSHSDKGSFQLNVYEIGKSLLYIFCLFERKLSLVILSFTAEIAPSETESLDVGTCAPRRIWNHFLKNQKCRGKLKNGRELVRWDPWGTGTTKTARQSISRIILLALAFLAGSNLKRRKLNKLAEVKEWIMSDRYGELRSWYGFLFSLFGPEQRKRGV